MTLEDTHDNAVEPRAHGPETSNDSDQDGPLGQTTGLFALLHRHGVYARQGKSNNNNNNNSGCH